MEPATENVILKKLYYDIDNPTAFSSIARLYEGAKKEISKDKIRTWLQGQNAYTLHKQRAVNFKKNHYRLDNIGVQWQADLMDLSSLSDKNDKVTFVLLVIDSFSRYVFVRKLINKSASAVLTAFKSIVAEAEHAPYQLITDRGKEFFNKQMQNYLKSNEISHYAPSNDEFKAAIAERAIRSFKDVLFRSLTASYSHRYVDNLQKIARVLNTRYHRSIGRAPNDVTPNNVYEVWLYMKKQLEKQDIKTQHPKLEIGAFVRLLKNKNMAFAKGFLPNWTDEIFEVVEVVKHTPFPIYRVRDAHGETIEGFFYEKELQQVTKNADTVYRIEKILKHRTRKGVKEVLVSWRGYDSTHDSWIREDELIGEDE